MTDVKRLLAQANPPPPWIRPWAALTVHGIGENDVLAKQANLDLAVAAVNRLADYEAVKAALERLLDGPWCPDDRDARQDEFDAAESALARLRETVPA